MAQLPARFPFLLNEQATVLTLGGLGSALSESTAAVIMAGLFGGEVLDGHIQHHIPYDSLSGADANVDDGVTHLDEHLSSISGPKIVLGLSLGAAVATKWLAVHGPTSDIPPSELSFVLAGNPARRYGGILHTPIVTDNPFMGMTEYWAPVDTPYTVTDIVKQYDVVGDVPTVTTSPNYLLALAYVLTAGNLSHSSYPNVSLTSPDHITFSEGNITYIWSPIKPWWIPEFLWPLIEDAYDRPVGTTTPPPPAPYPPGAITPPARLPDMCAATWEAVKEQRAKEERERQKQPLGRLWDAEWRCQHVLGNEHSASLTWNSNDSGPGQIELPFDSPAAQWVHDYAGRINRGEGRNVFLTMDYCGARWSGMVDKYSVDLKEDGDKVLVLTLLSDYEKVKWYTCWSNPFMGAALQFPRAFVLAGPVTWILKTTLWLQLWREHNPLLTLPDDPLRLSSWFVNTLDQSDWPVVVKPESFLDAMASGVVWGIVFSRFKTWHDAANIMLEDAELSVTWRRYLEGDEPPWPGANLRAGTLVLDIADKSGIYVGTSHGGNIFDGLARTVAEFIDDFVDPTIELIEDADTPQDYLLPGCRLTTPEKPYVVYMAGETSPIQTSSWINSPAKGVQVLAGGHSMPGINETISATIQAAGDILGGLVQIGSLGGSIDTLVAPLYEDTILAWSAVKSTERAQNSGWDRLFEYFSEPTGKAYTIASLMVIRAGFWATKTVISWEADIADGRPFLVGDNRIGHYWLDDRIGLVLEGDETIHMDRCRKIELVYDADTPPEWRLTVGDPRIHQDPAQRAWGRIEQMVAGLRDLGVW